jgi:hypothetical protein
VDRRQSIEPRFVSSEDETILNLCGKIAWAAFGLKRGTSHSVQRFVDHTDPNFVEAWRIYKEHYEKPLATISLAELIGSRGDAFEDLLAAWPSPNKRKLQGDWEDAADEAKERANKIGWALWFAENQFEFEKGYIADEQEIEEVKEGIRE